MSIQIKIKGTGLELVTFWYSQGPMLDDARLVDQFYQNLKV